MQSRKYKQGTITYLGSPYQLDWSGVNEPKGFHVLDIKTEAMEFVENNVSPQHKKILLSELVSAGTITKELKEAFSPLSVAITLEDEIDISRSDMLVHPDNMPRIDRHFAGKGELLCRIKALLRYANRGGGDIRRQFFRPAHRGVFDRHAIRVGLQL